MCDVIVRRIYVVVGIYLVLVKLVPESLFSCEMVSFWRTASQRSLSGGLSRSFIIVQDSWRILSVCQAYILECFDQRELDRCVPISL